MSDPPAAGLNGDLNPANLSSLVGGEAAASPMTDMEMAGGGGAGSSSPTQRENTNNIDKYGSSSKRSKDDDEQAVDSSSTVITSGSTLDEANWAVKAYHPDGEVGWEQLSPLQKSLWYYREAVVEREFEKFYFRDVSNLPIALAAVLGTITRVMRRLSNGTFTPLTAGWEVSCLIALLLGIFFDQLYYRDIITFRGDRMEDESDREEEQRSKGEVEKKKKKKWHWTKTRARQVIAFIFACVYIQLAGGWDIWNQAECERLTDLNEERTGGLNITAEIRQDFKEKYCTEGISPWYVIVFLLVLTFTVKQKLQYQLLTTCLHFLAMICGFIVTYEEYITYGWKQVFIFWMFHTCTAVAACTFACMQWLNVRKQFEQSIAVELSYKSALDRQLVVNTLLESLVPTSVLSRLLDDSGSLAADHASMATVLFSDIASFTLWSSSRSAGEVVAMLNTMVTEFDEAAYQFGGDVERVKTIGDAYWAVAGLPEPISNHAAVLCAFAQKMQVIVHALNKLHPEWAAALGGVHMEVDATAVSSAVEQEHRPLRLRIGLHSGPLDGALLGTVQVTYEVFGPTNTIAAMTEQLGEPGYVCVTEEVLDQLDQNDKIRFAVLEEGSSSSSTKRTLETPQGETLQLFLLQPFLLHEEASSAPPHVAAIQEQPTSDPIMKFETSVRSYATRGGGMEESVMVLSVRGAGGGGVTVSQATGTHQCSDAHAASVKNPLLSQPSIPKDGVQPTITTTVEEMSLTKTSSSLAVSLLRAKQARGTLGIPSSNNKSVNSSAGGSSWTTGSTRSGGTIKSYGSQMLFPSSSQLKSTVITARSASPTGSQTPVGSQSPATRPLAGLVSQQQGGGAEEIPLNEWNPLAVDFGLYTTQQQDHPFTTDSSVRRGGNRSGDDTLSLGSHHSSSKQSRGGGTSGRAGGGGGGSEGVSKGAGAGGMSLDEIRKEEERRQRFLAQQRKKRGSIVAQNHAITFENVAEETQRYSRRRFQFCCMGFRDPNAERGYETFINKRMKRLRAATRGGMTCVLLMCIIGYHVDGREVSLPIVMFLYLGLLLSIPPVIICNFMKTKYPTVDFVFEFVACFLSCYSIFRANVVAEEKDVSINIIYNRPSTLVLYSFVPLLLASPTPWGVVPTHGLVNLFFTWPCLAGLAMSDSPLLVTDGFLIFFAALSLFVFSYIHERLNRRMFLEKKIADYHWEEREMHVRETEDVLATMVPEHSTQALMNWIGNGMSSEHSISQSYDQCCIAFILLDLNTSYEQSIRVSKNSSIIQQSKGAHSSSSLAAIGMGEGEESSLTTNPALGDVSLMTLTQNESNPSFSTTARSTATVNNNTAGSSPLVTRHKAKSSKLVEKGADKKVDGEGKRDDDEDDLEDDVGTTGVRMQKAHLSVDEEIMQFRNTLTKIKTVGDIVMLAGPFTDDGTLEEAAADLVQLVAMLIGGGRGRGRGTAAGGLSHRTGLHVGPIMTAVLGLNRPTFDIFGDSVNTCSRVMTTGTVKRDDPNGVLVSAAPNNVTVGDEDENSKSLISGQTKKKHRSVAASVEFLSLLSTEASFKEKDKVSFELEGFPHDPVDFGPIFEREAKGKGNIRMRQVVLPGFSVVPCAINSSTDPAPTDTSVDIHAAAETQTNGAAEGASGSTMGANSPASEAVASNKIDGEEENLWCYEI